MTATPLTLVVCAAPLADRAAEIALALRRAGWDVSVVSTPAAAGWVDEEAVREATGRGVAVDYRRVEEPKRPRPAAVVACPLTFNSLNKLASGVSDNLALGLLNEALAARTPTVVVPVVSDRLWPHPAVAPSVERLMAAGIAFVDPRTGAGVPGPVQSGTGGDVAAAFDTAWLVTRLGQPSAA